MTTILDVPGSNPPSPFLSFFDSISAGPSSIVALHNAATHIVATITTSPDPNTELYKVWDAFFTFVVTRPESHSNLLRFLDALAVQSPTQPDPVRLGSNARSYLHSYLQSDGMLHWSLLPRYHDQWRDTHDILEAWRDWDGVRASGTQELDCPVATYYLRFCEYSAAELKHYKGPASLCIWVFHACRNVLECKRTESHQLKSHRISSDQLWELDVRVTATWLRDGAQALWKADARALRAQWAVALDEETDFWPGNRGLTRERWRLWEDRLHGLAADCEHFDELTRTVICGAANVIHKLLQSD